MMLAMAGRFLTNSWILLYKLFSYGCILYCHVLHVTSSLVPLAGCYVYQSLRLHYKSQAAPMQ